MLPVVAIVGRPNVGKSTLFNRMVGQRKALVHDRPGVTRDRLTARAEWEGREIVLVDTGGFEPDLAALPEGDLFRVVREQAAAAMAEADVVILVVDRQAGLTPADRLTADILRRSGRADGRVVVAVNKCDGPRHDLDAVEFHELGLEPLITISAEHGRGMLELWEAVGERLPPPADEPEDDDAAELRIAIIGKPNIGKSTLANRLLGEERLAVHDMPGTTMDAVDVILEDPERPGRRYRLVDTAGVRRKTRIDDDLETRATLHAIRTIERCHVTLLMLDGERGVTNQDARLASLVVDRGRALVLLVNRWDRVREDPERNVRVVEDEIRRELPHVAAWAPRLYISALTGKGCHRILPLVEQVFAEFDRRVPTGELNRFLEAAVAASPPPQKHHHRVRLNYATQPRVRPPTFVIWSNSPDAIKAPYRRYLENRLREAFGFQGTPIRLHLRRKRKPGEPRSEGGA